MVGTVILVIFCIICVLLLLPVRVKASFGDGKWSVAVYYVFIRVFRKESKEKPKSEKPPKPEDVPEGEKPAPETVTPAKPKPEASLQKPDAPPEPSVPENTPKPETVTESPKPDTVAESPKPEAEADLPEDDDFLFESDEDLDAPAEEQRKKRRKKPAAEDAGTEKPKKRGFIHRLKPQSLPEWMGLIKDVLGLLSPALRFLTKHLHFRHIKLYLAVASDDPANTALLYGKICAAAYNLLGALQCWVDIETDEFRILADFYNDKITFRAAAELRVSPMAALLLVLIFGIKFLWRTLCRFRREDREAALKARETAPLTQTQS